MIRPRRPQDRAALLGFPEERTLKRFWAKVQINEPDQCWPWIAKAKQGPGYGAFALWSRGRGGLQRASRLAWIFYNGRPVPTGMHILHTCDNPPCCNPAHLFPGTHSDNMQDMHSKRRGNQSRTGRFGERGSNTKLTALQVAQIRQLRQDGVSGREIALRFGISRAQVSRIGTFKRWPENAA
jgi:hypothetical protein